MSNVSISFLSASIDSCAMVARFLPSKLNGLVTIAIERIFFSFSARAMTVNAHEPVPPPMPPVKNTISASSRRSIILLKSSSAARLPSSGFAPAPRPFVDFNPS